MATDEGARSEGEKVGGLEDQKIRGCDIETIKKAKKVMCLTLWVLR